MDNASLHFTDDVAKALDKLDLIELVRLPTYSPRLNYIEKVWKWMKPKVVHVHPWSNDFNEFKRHVRATLDSIDANTEEILRYTGLCPA